MPSAKRRSLLLFSATASSSLMVAPAFALPMPSVSLALTPAGGSEQTFFNDDNPVASLDQVADNVRAFADATAGFTTGTNATVTGNGNASSDAVLTDSIFNNTGAIVDYFFAFRINQGRLELDDGGEPVATDDTASAGMSALVRVNGALIWSIELGLDLFDNVYSISDGNGDDDGVLSGFSSSVDVGGAVMNWAPSVFSVSLGTLNPTQSLEMSYTLSTRAVGDYDTAECGNDYGVGCYLAYAGASDPAGIDGTVLGISAIPRVTAAVPSAATLALMGIGLAGMGAARRRIRRHS